MKLKFIIYALALAFPFVSCVEEKQPVSFGVEYGDFSMEPEGGVRKVQVNVEGKWAANISADAKSWILVSPSTGIGSTLCTVRIDSTLSFAGREGTIRFLDMDSKNAQDIKISQKGFEKQIVVSYEDGALDIPDFAPADARTFDVKVTSNVPYDIQYDFGETAPWIENTDKNFDFKPERGARPRTVKLSFKWDGNLNPLDREALIAFIEKDVKDGVNTEIKVKQGQAPEITPDRQGDSLAIVKIEEKLGIHIQWNHDERLDYWSGVELWMEGDPEVTPEMVGRLKSVQFYQSRVKDGEGIPDEFKYLTCLRNLSLYSNANKFNCSFSDLGGIAELKNLRFLQIFSFGLTEMPEGLKELKNLVTLDLSSNNITNLPVWFTPENFPELRNLNLVGNARYTYSDLNIYRNNYPDVDKWGGFLNVDGRNDKLLERLFRFDRLQTLFLTNNLIHGTIPDMAGYPEYDPANEADWKNADGTPNDTLAVLRQKLTDGVLKPFPKVLPECKSLRINVNYLYGPIPDWIKYHPRMMRWGFDGSIYNQKADADYFGRVRSDRPIGDIDSFDYYWEVYPLLKPKY